MPRTEADIRRDISAARDDIMGTLDALAPAARPAPLVAGRVRAFVAALDDAVWRASGHRADGRLLLDLARVPLRSPGLLAALALPVALRARRRRRR